MGNAVQVNSNVVNTNYPATLRDSLTVSGDINANGNIVGDNSTNISGINSVTATSFSGNGASLTNVNADTLDTLDSTQQFLRSDAADTKTTGIFYSTIMSKLRLGSGGDLNLYHNGGYSVIENDSNSSDLFIRAAQEDKDVIVQSDDGSGGIATYFRADGSTGETILYHYGTQKLATKSTGIDVTGLTETDTLTVSGNATFQSNVLLGDSDEIRLGDGGDLQLWHNGGQSYISNITGPLNIRTTSGDDINLLSDDDVGIVVKGRSRKQTPNFIADGAVELYYDNVKKFETTASGIDVTGHAQTDTLNVSGVSTFAGNVRFNSTIAVNDGTTGTSGQYLKSIGTGVTWATFPTLRTTQTNTATAGQTTFNFSYNVNFLDVFVNGVKLTSSEYTASNGSQIILSTPAFVGEIVEFHSYNTTSTGGGGGSYGNNDVDTHLNTSTASSGEVLSWTGTDYDWVAQSGGGGGASNINGLSDGRTTI